MISWGGRRCQEEGVPIRSVMAATTSMIGVGLSVSMVSGEGRLVAARCPGLRMSGNDLLRGFPFRTLAARPASAHVFWHRELVHDDGFCLVRTDRAPVGDAHLVGGLASGGRVPSR